MLSFVKLQHLRLPILRRTQIRAAPWIKKRTFQEFEEVQLTSCHSSINFQAVGVHEKRVHFFAFKRGVGIALGCPVFVVVARAVRVYQGACVKHAIQQLQVLLTLGA